MTRAEIDQFIADTKQKAVEILVADGNHAPLAFLFPPDGRPEGPVLLSLEGVMGADAGADAAADLLRNVVRRTNASGVVTVIEAWVSPAAVSRRWGLSPAEDPGHVEALMLAWEFRLPSGQERVGGVWFQPFRHEGGRVVLGEAVAFPAALSGGRFAGILA
jgi:hypothetical protein